MGLGRGQNRVQVRVDSIYYIRYTEEHHILNLMKTKVKAVSLFERRSSSSYSKGPVSKSEVLAGLPEKVKLAYTCRRIGFLYLDSVLLH